MRPKPCGVSVGHHAIRAGTLGCLARKHGDEDGIYILSNNHVLADGDRGKIGDLILEPAPDDGGKLDDPIAKLSDFEPIMQGNKVTLWSVKKCILRYSIVHPREGTTESA